MDRIQPIKVEFLSGKGNKMLKIYGASDDLVCANIGFEKKCPCCGAEIKNPTKAIITDSEGDISAYEKVIGFIIGDKEGGAVVDMHYDVPGVWCSRVRQINEDVPIPWPISVVTDDELPGHSVVVLVDCPENTSVEVLRSE